METEKEIQVSASLLKKWKLACQHGDKTAINIKYGVPRDKVIKAFNGTATPDLIEKINQFYSI